MSPRRTQTSSLLLSAAGFCSTLLVDGISIRALVSGLTVVVVVVVVVVGVVLVGRGHKLQLGRVGEGHAIGGRGLIVNRGRGFVTKDSTLVAVVVLVVVAVVVVVAGATVFVVGCVSVNDVQPVVGGL